jgi:hypothetical protein
MGPFTSEWTEADVEAVIARGEPSELLYVPILVGMNADASDFQWAQDICFKLASHADFNVRGNAILGLGHIARTCRKLDTGRAVPLVSGALADGHEYVRGHAEDAASDFHAYLGVLVPGYSTKYTEKLYDTVDELRRKIDG